MATNVPGVGGTRNPDQPNQPDQPVRHYTIRKDCGPRHHDDCGPRDHDDCEPHHHGWREKCCSSCGQRRCICGFKPFHRLELAPELCDLGVRLAETVLAVPLVIATGLLAELSRCRPDPCGHERHHHDPDDCCDEKRHRRDVDDCCDEKKHLRRGTADIVIEAREDDIHHKVILVQNNGPHPVTVTLSADPWTDLAGNAIGAAPAVTFTPPTLTLAPCEALETVAEISVKAPLTPGKAYLTRIHFQGSGARSILLELCVAPKNQIDNCVETDPCRRRIGSYVDVCDDDWDDSRDCCHPKKFDPCCQPSHGKHWHWQRDPWHWCGPDPYRFWYGLAHWQRLLLPHVAGQRCC